MALTGALHTPQKCFVNATVQLSAKGVGGLGEWGPWQDPSHSASVHLHAGR